MQAPRSGARFCAAAAAAPHTGAAHEFRPIKVPTIEQCAATSQTLSEYDNRMIHLLAEQGDNDACAERLRRNIMAVDSVEYDKAGETLEKIHKANMSLVGVATSPYQVGIVFFLVTGIGSIPMTFHKGTSLWFNDVYVTGEVPPAEDIQTFYEVGSWSWSWMEPLTGIGCFVLLALQAVRNYMQIMGIKPYGDWLLSRRASGLVAKFPQYNEDFVAAYAKTASLTPNTLAAMIGRK